MNKYIKTSIITHGYINTVKDLAKDTGINSIIINFAINELYNLDKKYTEKPYFKSYFDLNDNYIFTEGIILLAEKLNSEKLDQHLKQKASLRVYLRSMSILSSLDDAPYIKLFCAVLKQILTDFGMNTNVILNDDDSISIGAFDDFGDTLIVFCTKDTHKKSGRLVSKLKKEQPLLNVIKLNREAWDIPTNTHKLFQYYL